MVVGSDLTVNGDIGEAAEEGSPSTDPVSPAEPPTSPTEGTSMLGKKHLRFPHVTTRLNIQSINLKDQMSSRQYLFTFV